MAELYLPTALVNIMYGSFDPHWLIYFKNHQNYGQGVVCNDLIYLRLFGSLLYVL